MNPYSTPNHIEKRELPEVESYGHADERLVRAMTISDMAIMSFLVVFVLIALCGCADHYPQRAVSTRRPEARCDRAMRTRYSGHAASCSTLIS